MRLLAWLLTGAALWAALSAGGAPADPVRAAGGDSTSNSVASGYATLVISYADHQRYVRDLKPEYRQKIAHDTWRVQPSPGFLAPAEGLVVYAATPVRTAAFAELLEACRLAAAWALERPVVVSHGVAIPKRRFLGNTPPREYWSDDGAENSTVVCLMGPLRAIYPQPSDHRRLLDWLNITGMEPSIHYTSDSAIATGDRSVMEELAAWRTRSLTTDGSVVVLHPAPPSCSFFPTQALFAHASTHPGEWPLDLELANYLRRCCGEYLAFEATVGGLYLEKAPVRAQEIQQRLKDPRLIQLAWDLGQRSHERRAAARRAAINDDDPELADFAADDVVLSPWLDQELSEAPVELLRAWPHRAAAGSVFRNPTVALGVLERLQPEAAEYEMQQLARTCANADRLEPIITYAFSHDSPVLRRAARDAYLARLPRGAFQDTLGLGRTWTLLERDQFVDALVDRLRQEFAHGDPLRASDATADMMVLAIEDAPTGSRSHSRLRELAAHLVFDPEHGAKFRDQKYRWVPTMAAEECLRSSDPHLRAQACRLLRDDRLFGKVPSEYEFDPGLVEFYPESLQELRRRANPQPLDRAAGAHEAP